MGEFEKMVIVVTIGQTQEPVVSLALLFGGVAEVKEEHSFVDYGIVESKKVH